MIIGVDIRPLMTKEPSGVSGYLFHLLDNLFKLDRENQYKLFYNSFHNVREQLPQWSYPNVKFYGYRWPNKLLTASLIFFKRPYFDKLIGGCDLFIIPNLCFYSLTRKCKKLVVVHDLSFKFYRGFFKPKWRLAYWLAQAKENFFSADKILAVSQNTKRDLVKEYGLVPEKIEVIYPGVLSLEPRAQSPELQLNLPSQFILTLGTREPRKNLIGVVKAFEKVKEGLGARDLGLGLVIAGGSGWLNTEVDQEIKQSRFKDKIKILGYVSEEEKLELYRRAEIFIYPSFYEGFGFPPLEAMSCGCPVITSLSSATSEICGQAALLVNPYNIEELVRAILELTVQSLESRVQSPGFRAELIRRGYERIKEFSWEKTAQETLKILTEFNKA
jgi:glycosyltransferase involved in cell wall biosynthesis